MSGVEEADSANEEGGVKVARLARDSGLNVGGAVVRQIAVFGVTFLIAQTLGADALGVYAQAFALRALLLLVCLLGMRVAMTYFVASFRAAGDHGGVRGAVRIGLAATAVVSTVVAAITILLAPALATGYFDDPSLTVPIRLAMLSLPFIVIMTVALAATQGFKSMRAFAGIGLVFEPTTRLVLTGVVLALGFGIDATLAVLLISSATAAYLALRALKKRLATLGPGRPRFPYRTVATFASFSWVGSTATQGLLWGDIIILGAFVGSEEIGIYQVATRVVLLATFAVAPLTASLAPRVADSWTRDLPGDVSDHYVTLTGWTWRLSLPVFVVLIVFTEPILSLFGEEFVAGAAVAMILAAGALVETLAAPAGVVLNQVGRNRLNMVFAVMALVLDVVLAVLLIPVFGIEGAAIAWTVTLGAVGLSRILAVRRLVTRRFPWSMSHTKGAIAAVAALAVGWGFDAVTDVGSLIEVIVGSVLVFGVYVGVLLILGLSHEDRRLLGPVARRASRLPVFRTGPMRRIRDRLGTRSLVVPTEELRLDHLISPLRYDVLVRAELFSLVRDNRDLIATNVDDFVTLAKQSSYYVWYCDIAAQVIGIDVDNQAAVDEGFALRVRKSLDLLDRYEKNGGFDARFPVTVRPISDDETPSGKHFIGSRFVPVDGCHRLALLHLDGRESLQPSEYRLMPSTAPIVDNTPALVDALHLSSADYYRFIGSGFLDQPVRSRDQLLAGADAAGESVRSDVDVVLAIDEGYARAANNADTGHRSSTTRTDEVSEPLEVASKENAKP